MNDELIKISEEEFIKKELKTDKFIKLEASGGRKQNITVWINYDIDPDKIIIGDVNLKICEGKYLEYLQNNIKKSLNSKFKIKNSNDLLLGLKLYASLIFPEPEFDSQTKRRMESRKVKPLIDKLNSNLDSFLFQDEILEIINSHINQKYNKKIKSPSKRLSAANKVRDCNKIPGEVLYLLEGESADGTLKQIKDRETEASLPLKGKILNVAKSSLQQIYDNEEIKNLLEALGEPESRRYKKIKILCDADADGHHIICLLLLILQKFAPDMIKEHKVSILLPPLYGAKNKKEFIPIYDESDLEQYKTKYNITRFKGLGKMNPIELEKVIRNGREYIVSLPLNTEELLKIITSTEVKKKLLNSPDTDLKIILDLAK
jgi:DNA gyrase/topoisomerase IV subunit B